MFRGALRVACCFVFARADAQLEFETGDLDDLDDATRVRLNASGLFNIDTGADLDDSTQLAINADVEFDNDDPQSGSRRRHVPDDTKLSKAEKYLEPYLDDLFSYRDNPIAKTLITLTNFVDVVPTWLMNAFVPLLIPKSTLTIPLMMKILIPAKIGPIDGIPPRFARLELVHISIDKLNKFKKLKPIKFMKDTRFTWRGHIIWKRGEEVSVKVGARLVLLDQFNIDVDFELKVKSAGVDYELIAAFDKARMCEVWGGAMTSSQGCAAYPIHMDAENGVSGVKLADLTLHASDFDVAYLKIQPLPWGLDQHLEQLVQRVLAAEKPKILEHMTGSVSKALMQGANLGLGESIRLIHKFYPCELEEHTHLLEVDEVCFSNNALFRMKWGYRNCQTHETSIPSKKFNLFQTRCMDVRSIWPDAEPGHTLRAAVRATFGLHEIVDPVMVYKPNSNRAAFECSGASFAYACKLIGVVPSNRSAVALASQICVLNHAGFVLKFSALDKRTNTREYSRSFPINQRKCMDLTDLGFREGDELETTVKALGGKRRVLERLVEYRANKRTVTYECKGSTWKFRCDYLDTTEREDETLALPGAWGQSEPLALPAPVTV